MRTVIVLAGALLVTGFVAAQQKNAVAEALTMEMHNHSSNMIAAAEAMPADKYSFRASEQQVSFGDLVAHAAAANNALCAAAAGEKAPDTPAKGNGAKDTLVSQLKESFAYCDRAFQKVDASKLADEVQIYGRKVTKAWVLFHMALDWGDHYSQAATMLRQNGITPPSVQRRSSGD
jgi:uncharacterized damage-inducible protein DinB